MVRHRHSLLILLVEQIAKKCKAGKSCPHERIKYVQKNIAYLFQTVYIDYHTGSAINPLSKGHSKRRPDGHGRIEKT